MIFLFGGWVQISTRHWLGLSVVVPQQCSFIRQAVLFAAATTAHPAALQQKIFIHLLPKLRLCNRLCNKKIFI
jgi:hypothetical protein